jgi:adenylate cyclase
LSSLFFEKKIDDTSFGFPDFGHYGNRKNKVHVFFMQNTSKNTLVTLLNQFMTSKHTTKNALKPKTNPKQKTFLSSDIFF